MALLSADFVHWDDDIYVTTNEKVLKGITLENIRWAFSTIFFGFYYPVTWLSHMLDVSVYGLRPWGHHLTSILIHVLNSSLIFIFLKRAAVDEIKSFVIAALFSVHPLNVESVAWISERKNLLAGLFFFLGMNFYLSYVKKPTIPAFTWLFTAYMLGLMSKSVVVTFPLALCLIDIWPLKRWELSFSFLRENYKRLILEKLPFFLPVPIFDYLTILAQKRANAFANFDKYPFDQRLAGAVLAYARYICDFLFPVRLAAFYPHLRNSYGVFTLLSSFIILAVLFILFLKLWKKEKLYMTGYLWFLINLAPVIGIIQVGSQGSADRYMYIPMMGLLVIFVLGLFEISDKFVSLKPEHLYLFFSAVFVLFIIKSHYQSLVWKNSESLFTNMITASPNPSQGYTNMGLEYKKKGDYLKAIELYKKAIEADPLKAEAYNNLGNALYQMKDITGATGAYKKACGLNPQHSVMLYNLGLSEELLGDAGEAKKHYLKAISISPDQKSPRLRLIYLLRKENQLDEAMALAAESEELFEGEPEFPRIHCSMLMSLSRFADAKTAALKALDRFPGDPELTVMYGDACFSSGDLVGAETAFRRVWILNSKDAHVNFRLGEIMAAQGRPAEAAEFVKRASLLEPGNAEYKELYRSMTEISGGVNGR